jgi:hypothetical protein
MVSSSLDMALEELNTTLERLRLTCADDDEYVNLRSALPSDWPL